jgi:hypothetical protein
MNKLGIHYGLGESIRQNRVKYEFPDEQAAQGGLGGRDVSARERVNTPGSEELTQK